MPQFILCNKSNCPLANECYRYRAIPDENQLYNDFINICNKEDDHHFFIKIQKGDKIKEVKEKKAIEEG